MKKEKKFIFVIIGIAFILDQITKIIAYKKGWYIVNENIDKTNNGQYILTSIIIVIILLRYILNDNRFIKKDSKILLSLAVSGAIGNVIDRVWNKDVIVFINIAKSLSLNLSYIYILIAWVGMAVVLTRNSMKFIKNRKGDNRNSIK